MKLILCKLCQDVFKLDMAPRRCKCGACTGQYLPDGLHATYSGADAVPLGFENVSIAAAIRHQPETGEGIRFTAFVIPMRCQTFKKEPPK